MNELTRVLSDLERGEPRATDQLLPLVYDELREMAARHLAGEHPGQTLQATALVHEAYLRLVGCSDSRCWNSRGHFFGAAAEAMRRILVDHARSRQCLKRSGGRQRVALEPDALTLHTPPDEVLAVDEALARLGREDETAARLVQLRYFAGLTVEEAANALGISRSAAYRHWTYARAWIRLEIQGTEADHDDLAEK